MKIKTHKSKPQSVKQWLNDHIETLQKQKKRSMISFAIWANILVIINIATLSIASYAIYILLYNREKYGDNQVILYLTISSVAVIVVSFLLTFVVTIYKGVMKAQLYKKAMDRIHFEVIKRNYNQGDYAHGTKEEKEKLLLKRVQEYYWAAVDYKLPHAKKIIVLKAILGGNSV